MHWPGVADTPHLDAIRQQLAMLFEKDECVPIVSPPAEATPASEEGEPSLALQVPGISAPEASPMVELTRPAPGDVVVTVGTDIRPLRRVLIGVDDGRRSVYYDPQSPVDPLDNLNMMVTGSSGTGKTQFLKYLICQLRDQDKNILILDFKNDFASDSVFTDLARLSKVFVTFDGLPYNPLIPYPIRHPATGELFVQCGQHIAGVASVLKRTYGLGAQQQAAVKNAIVAAFDSMGIQVTGATRYEESMRFPDFSIVGDALRHDNQAAFNRLDPLFTLGLFREEYRYNSFHSLVGGSTILDLSQIPSDEIKNTLAQLVVLSAHAYYNSQQQLGTIRQVLIFDEAHRVLNSDYMLRLVRECRAYGVGAILSSQYPSDFPPEISGSMATKVIHGNERDIDRVRAIIQLIGCEGQEASVASLDRFQAFVDNRHYPHTLIRTMNYPLFLVWSYLVEYGTANRETLSRIDGLDTDKLPIVNLVRQLERLGIAEEREGLVTLLRQGD
jgi:DNA phosphorothioation-dependent restriction protein DptH